MAKTNPSAVARQKRVKRIRKKVVGTGERPRLRVFKSSKHIYAQLIDDSAGTTLASMSTLDKGFEKAKAAGISSVVFDRGGCLYHGRVKALSEGAREGGLEF